MLLCVMGLTFLTLGYHWAWKNWAEFRLVFSGFGSWVMILIEVQLRQGGLLARQNNEGHSDKEECSRQNNEVQLL